ncbi:MAG: SpoIIE family protein phosphatase [Lachnospiraceae bacterium]|nr:SpoIIE family protein phosphatase [Lachnospiraceae bacterium]
MPEKSVREMSSLERRHKSIEAKTFRSVLIGSLLLGLAALVIGLGFYTYALVDQYISEVSSLSKSAAAAMEEVADPAELVQEIMGTYRAQTDEQRREQNSQDYRGRFASYIGREDYQKIKRVLGFFRTSYGIDAVYLVMYDEKTSSMVYLVDPDEKPETAKLPGNWETAADKEISRFLSWNGSGKLYYIEKTKDNGWMCTSGVPVKDNAGNTIAFVVSDLSLLDIGKAMKIFVFQYSIVTLAIMIIVGCLYVRIMKKKLVEPINAIAGAAQKYVEDRRAGIRGGEHFSSLNIRTGDEIENLYLTMADMERDLEEHEENLLAITAEKERIGTELSLATRIQADMLPSIYPAFPDRPEFDIYATMDPAKEVGGDFYDFFLVDADHLCMVMADVSGKGVPAALFMMATKIILANNAMMGKSPAKILTDTNAAICSHNREEMFVTVWLGILEISTGRVVAANAGHEYPAIRMPDGRFELFKDKHGLVIGGMEGIKYKEYEFTMTPGARLFVYTDGVTEAMDADNALFGTAHMLDALNENPEGDTVTILGNVRAAVDRFVKDAEQFDDLTMLCMEYRGMDNQEKRDELVVEALTENLPQVTAFVDARLEAADCPMKAQMQIDVAVEEIFVNIAGYAYAPEIGMATVRVEVSEEPLTVTITFIDHGVPYDPLAKEDPDVTLSAEQRELGGLGIFMTKKLMDDVSYEYKDGQNILTLRKKL